MRGLKHSRRRGKTPVLSPEEARKLLDGIPSDTLIGKCDSALIGLMTYTFARIGATTGMEVRNAYLQSRRLWVRLHEKGGSRWSFQATIRSRLILTTISKPPTSRTRPGPRFPDNQARDRAVVRNCPAPGQCLRHDPTPCGRGRNQHHRINHTFRATGITAYLKNGGTLEKAANIANHSSTRTTQLMIAEATT